MIVKNNCEVYRIINRKTNVAEGVYSRAYHDEFDFRSADDARTANCHGMYGNKEKYKIDKYKVTYTLIEEDV